MNDDELSIRAFLFRYFPVFIGAIFASMFSVVFAVPLFFESYYPDLSLADNVKYTFLSGMALALLIVHCNFMIARGRPHWVWPSVVMLSCCFLGVLPTIEYRPNTWIYALGALLPLVGLLLFNSKRHREMRARLLVIRHLRQAVIAKHRSR